MSPRHNRPKAKPQHPKSAEPMRAKSGHRFIEDIRRDIANSPAQALPALHAELIAALDAERED